MSESADYKLKLQSFITNLLLQEDQTVSGDGLMKLKELHVHLYIFVICWEGKF